MDAANNMNIQIDTKNKTLKLVEDTNLKELVEVLDKLFPDKEWLDYKLETNTIIYNWSNPITIYRHQWMLSPIVVTNCGAHTPAMTTNFQPPVFNISVN